MFRLHGQQFFSAAWRYQIRRASVEDAFTTFSRFGSSRLEKREPLEPPF